MDMDMQYGHGHAAWTCTRSTALVMQHVSGQWTCMDAGCRNADKEFSPASLVSVSLQRLVRHRHSGIVVSPVPLVTEQSVSAQPEKRKVCGGRGNAAPSTVVNPPVVWRKIRVK